MSAITSFPPLSTEHARVLILGSMPGIASLDAGQYYAHPRNLFWPILGELLGFDPASDYSHRVRALLAADIAVWDVVQSCHRPGSLDASIDPRSVITNDFVGFFQDHPNLTQVFFNGATAEQLFHRWVSPSLTAATLQFQRLPSTSPANASLTYQQKLQSWCAIRPVTLSVPQPRNR